MHDIAVAAFQDDMHTVHESLGEGQSSGRCRSVDPAWAVPPTFPRNNCYISNQAISISPDSN